MADGYAHYPRSSPQPAQTMSSVLYRDASLNVRRPLRNEQGDSLEQLKKNAIFTFFPFYCFTARSKAGGRSVELERVAVIAYLAPSTWASKSIISQSISAMDLDGSACMHHPPVNFAWT